MVEMIMPVLADQMKEQCAVGLTNGQIVALVQDDQSFGIHPETNCIVGKCRRYTVAVAVKDDQAGR